MVKKTVKNYLVKHHFWRDIELDELAELYTSMIFRNLALSLVGIFIPIFLYTLHYSVARILLFYAITFSLRVGWDFLAAHLTARLGPKHTIAISFGCQIVTMLMFTSLPSVHWPLLLLAIMWGISQSLFFIAFHVDFSKIKHSEHGGKEIGFMTMMERGGSLLGPVIGGVVATVWAPQYVFLVGTVCYILGLIPLFMTPEPVVTRQKLKFDDFPARQHVRDIVSYSALALESTICVLLWPLFIALFIVSQDVFVKVGILSSLGVVAAICSAQAMGKLIDTHQGLKLMRVTLLINAGLHLLRPLLKTFVAALGLNLANELVTVGYRMTYIKGAYDAADSLPGLRIVYLTSLEAFGNLTKAVAYWGLFLTTMVVSSRMTLNIAFYLGFAVSLIILVERYPALRQGYVRAQS